MQKPPNDQGIVNLPPASMTPAFLPSPTERTLEFPNLPVSGNDAMSVIQDVTIPDGTFIEAGKIFVKSWRIQNSGDLTWDMGYRIGLVQGDPMGAGQIAVPHFLSFSENITLNSNHWQTTVSQVFPKDIVDLVMIFVSPDTPGNYSGIWQLINKSDERLDPVIWVSIIVENQLKKVEKDWSGEWLITDPYDPHLGPVHAHIVEDGSMISGIFYSHSGNPIVLEGWTSEQGIIQGTLGPPWNKVVNTIMWRLTPDGRQFQTVNRDGELNHKIVCGARVNAAIPNPCSVNN